jgi:hypothetical protein
MIMSARDRLLNRVGSLVDKIAAAVLWKYVDPEGTVFYLSERHLGTVRSPFSGKSFTAKPIRQSLTDISKELRAGDAKIKGSLWHYADPDGGSFYYDQRLVGTVKSPLTGKAFKASPQRFTLSEVGKELKLESAPDPNAKLLSEMQVMLAVKGYDPDFATTLQEEGMGPAELEERLKDTKQFEFNYNVPKKVEPKTADVKVAALTAAEKKVVDAFYEKKPAHGGMLTTDGKKLEKNGIGGSNFAKWEGDKIVVDESRPQVKNDEEILRYMKKSIPANTLASHIWFRKTATSPEQWDMAKEIIEKGEDHPAIKIIKNQYDKILDALKECEKHSKGMQRVGAGHTEDPTFVMTYLQPEILELASECTTIAKQLEQRLGRA